LLRQQFVRHRPENIREAEIAALETVDQLFVVGAEQMQDGCVEVVNMGFVRGGAAELSGISRREAELFLDRS